MYKVTKYLESSKNNILKLTKDLVSIPTVNPPGQNYEKIVHFLQKKLNAIGLKTRIIETPKSLCVSKQSAGVYSKRLNLIADFDFGKKKTIHINGHYDVVPPGPGFKSPFIPQIRNNKLFGRGTEDMKATIAASIYAVEAIIKSGLRPNYNIQFSFTPDEEIGGQTGFGYLVEKGLIKADYAIGEGYTGNFVSIGNKGLLWMEIALYGKNTHGSTPYKGINAFEKLIRVSNDLIDLKDKLRNRKTKFPMKDLRDVSATMTLGGILRGATKANVVPDHASFSIDRRILPEESLQQAKKEILDILKQAKRKDKEFRYNYRFICEGRPNAISVNSPLCKAVSKAIKSVYHKEAKLGITPVITDMRFLMDKGVDAIGYSVDGDGSWHSDGEHIQITSLLNTAKVYAMTVMELE